MTVEEYRKRFFKIHPQGGSTRTETRYNMGLEAQNYRFCRGRYNIGKGEVQIYYLSDGAINPFLTYTDTYLRNVYMKEHPLMDDSEDTISSKKAGSKNRGASSSSKSDESKGSSQSDNDEIQRLLDSPEYKRAVRKSIELGGGLADASLFGKIKNLKFSVESRIDAFTDKIEKKADDVIDTASSKTLRFLSTPGRLLKSKIDKQINNLKDKIK